MFKNAYISTYLEVNLDVRVCGLQYVNCYICSFLNDVTVLNAKHDCK